ncbi:MAG: PPC domain-containing DNA-binding protein [Chloroflexota bacterium]|nr:PPC domain-containing DNA-binding protein [Chloroflexota bacterium]
MQIKALDGHYLIRLEPGDEVIESLKHFADEHEIGFAELYAIGTFQQVTLGYFDTTAKVYRNRTVEEQVEVLNLSGNISRGEEGEPIVHAHVTVGLSDYHALGGHLVEATVNPTLETVVSPASTTVYRRRDPATGLTLWDMEATEPVQT